MAAQLTYEIIGGPQLARTLHRLGVDVDKVLEAAVVAGAQIVERAAEPQAPGPHIEIGDPERDGSGVAVEIGPDRTHWYYKFPETGAVPHPIEARDSNVLRLFGRSGPEFRRRVAHPGRPAAPFLRPALDQNERPIQMAVGDQLRVPIRRIA